MCNFCKRVDFRTWFFMGILQNWIYLFVSHKNIILYRKFFFRVGLRTGTGSDWIGLVRFAEQRHQHRQGV